MNANKFMSFMFFRNDTICTDRNVTIFTMEFTLFRGVFQALRIIQSSPVLFKWNHFMFCTDI